MTDDEVRTAAYADGWEARRRNLYDEDGVDGWEWMHPVHGDEYTEVGDHGEPPPIPGIVRELYDAEYRARVEEERREAEEKTRRFLDILDRIT